MNGFQPYVWHGVHTGEHVVMHGHMRAGLSKEQRSKSSSAYPALQQLAVHPDSTTECEAGEKSFSEMVKQGYNNPEYCDVAIVADDGRQFYCSKFILKCGSDYFHKMFSHEMKEQITNQVYIKEVESDILEKALLFMHSGQCDLHVTDLLPLGSFAHRHEVVSLIKFCSRFEREKFMVDETTCCIVLEQCHRYPETPQSVQAKCESAVRQRVVDLFTDTTLMDSFKNLSYMAVKGVLASALPEMFSIGTFPKPYIKLGEALIAWLNTDPDARGEYAVELFSMLEFEAFGLEGLSRIAYPEESETKVNWVRSHAAIEKQALDALRLAGKQPYHFNRTQEWRPSCSGRYTILCSGSNSRRGNVGTAVATFDLLASDVLVLNCSENTGNAGCSISLKCGPSKKTNHVLLAIGPNSVRYYDENLYGCDLTMDDPVHESLLGTTLGREGHQCRCRFQGRGTAKEVRQILNTDGQLRPWVSPYAIEQYESPKLGLGAKITIFCRPPGSKNSSCETEKIQF